MKVAVVGLGAMGGRMAARLLAAGHELTVWNRSPDKAAPLVEGGAALAESPRDAAARSDAVLTMVADPAALAAVSEGADGIASGARPGATIAEMSTVGPAAIERLSGVLPDGVELLDAPVLGSLGEVEAGTLTIFAGGPAGAFERCRPLFEVLGTPLHVGELGMGAAAKLVANSTLFGALGVLGEAISLADGLGLPREVTFEVLAITPMGAQAERRRPSVESRDYALRFALSLALKDADLVVGAAEAAGRDVRLARAARSWLADAAAAGWGDRDYSSVLERIFGEEQP
ncbi:MAG TPA: NAD(P)-dependent oxidoreductase [Actinomycetota bacterium]|nr:NAD(P)-dependent oxidoreductase [Actinomycetota bacterium]